MKRCVNMEIVFIFTTLKIKEKTQMIKLSIRQISVLMALPLLLFFAVSGDGKFDWDKTIYKIQKFLRRRGRAKFE